MQKNAIRGIVGWILTLAGVLFGQADEPVVVELTPFAVYAGSYSAERPVVQQLSERMSREVRVDLQSRGGKRYQTDISIRGGIFEGTGLMVGGLALFDPQTGHYFSEIPLDPAFFGHAALLTGVENGVQGFNSTAGSIDWQWAALEAGGQVYGIIGSDSLFGGGLRYAGKGERLGYEIAVMNEAGDGSIEHGDFDLRRISGRVEYQLGHGTLRLFGGYVDKFYGWPGLYTGFDLKETDDYAVSLLGWQYEHGARGTGSSHRIGGYWRQVDDDYEFNRDSPNAFFEHKTEVYSLQGDGTLAFEQTELLYRWAWLTDRIMRSTSLTHGDFMERDYGEAAVLVRHTLESDWGEWAVYGGAALDTTSEDATVGLPQAGVSASGVSDGSFWKAYLEVSQTSRVPGYTALNSAPSGLFGGNSELGRERAETLEGGVALQKGSFSGKLVIFKRDDTDLVDWVYAVGDENARTASPVDLEVTGIEGWVRWDLTATALEIGYAWLDKEADYKTSLSSVPSGSFYALNYARHRMLVSIERRLATNLFGRIEAEYREHPENSLRSGPDSAFYLNVEASWDDCFGEGWTLVLRGENLTEETFEPVPGTPGPGREGSLSLAYAW